MKPMLDARPLAVAVAAFMVGSFASLLVARFDYERQASVARGQVVAELAVARATLEGSIQSTFRSTAGLVDLVSLQGGIDQSLFDNMARLAIEKNPHIRNIALAPDDTVKYVYPLAGNRVIGFRYQSIPEQYRVVRQAREQRRAILNGPVDLVQGGRGLIHRAPIFTAPGAGATSPRYWGVASVVVHLEKLIPAAALDPEGKLSIALRGRDGLGSAGEPISGDQAVFRNQPVLMDIQVPGGTWQIGATPAAGWQTGSPYRSQYFLFGFALSTLLGLGAGLWSHSVRSARVRNARLVLEMAERQKAETALHEEERRFRTLFESSPDPSWIIENNCFVECNAAAARMLGYADAAAVLDVHPAKLSPEFQPDGESSFSKAERMMELTRQQGVLRFEWIHSRADGSDFPAEVTLSSVALQGKQVIYCVWRDISARRQAEDELRASSDLLQGIVDSAGALIYFFDATGRLLLCNQQLEEMLGRRREEIIGRPRRDFFPEAVAAEHEANDQAVLRSGQRTSFEELTIEADGPHYYLTVKCPIIGSDGVRGVVGISTDITHRRRDEEKLKLAATVLASTAEGVVITDAHSNIVSVNRAFTDITGYTEAEVLGQNPRLLRSERQEPDFYQRLWHSLIEADVWQGEIWNRRKNGELFPEWLTITVIRDSHGEVSHYVGVFSDISSIKRSQDKLERLAHFDPLTELPNRVLFLDRLAHAIDRAQRYGQSIALLLLDLDGFKIVNDSLGHPVGDRLLSGVAGRLKECIRVEDTVARLGGDEFALILASMRDGADAIDVVRKILTSVEQPFDLDGVGAMVSASVGIAIYPADGTTPTDLVRNADAAMYGAKESGRNTYCFYQATMTHRAHERLQQEAALRRALERNEFEVWFQPQISLESGRLTGAEALVRWRDPARGLIPPLEFIPLAERTGLIIPLGEQVLDQVCGCARRWRAAGLNFGRLAVNVATPQIERSDFVATICRVLEAHQVPAICLEIEITESFIMQSASNARDVLLAIQALGISTAVDDFGTGYSSLAYLKNLPIDSLKIDRAFVSDLPDNPNDIAIARAIIAMGHSLGFKVIAEGIETEAQRMFLRSEGCDEGQGYQIGRPMPVAAFEDWLRSHAG